MGYVLGHSQDRSGIGGHGAQAQLRAPVYEDKVVDLLLTLEPAYVREGKSYLTIAFGCTGGRHRSVVLADVFRGRLADGGVATTVFHRDIDR